MTKRVSGMLKDVTSYDEIDFADLLQQAYCLEKFNKCAARVHRNTAFNPFCIHNLGQNKWFQDEDKSEDETHWSVKTKYHGKYTGLRNLGATCYVNSLLQVFFHTADLRQGIYNWEPVDPTKRLKLNDNGYVEAPDNSERIMKVVQELFLSLEHTARGVLDTKDFIDTLELSKDDQQDAAEFSQLFWSMLEQHLPSEITELYIGDSSYETECLQCGTVNTAQSRFTDLKLQVDGKYDLVDRINYLSIPDQLKGDNQYFCSVCQSKQDARRCFVIDRFPNILNLHLMRFMFDSETFMRKKDNSAIKFPSILKLREEEYELFAIVNHVGDGAHSGHYISHVKQEKDAWVRFNDDKITILDDLKLGDLDMKKRKQKCNEGEYASQSAYMLSYRRVSSPPPTTITTPPKLLVRVEQDNKEFLALVQLLREQAQLVAQQTEQKRIHMQDICTKIAAPDSDKFSVVDTKVLSEWIKTGEKQTYLLNTIACPHQNVEFTKVNTVKYINSVVTPQIFKNPSIVLTQDNLCHKCLRKTISEHIFISKLEQDFKKIMALQNNDKLTGWWVVKEDLRNLTNFVKQGLEGFNARVSCQHGKLHPDASRRRLISHDVREVISSYIPTYPVYRYDEETCPECSNSMVSSQEQHREILSKRRQLSRLNGAELPFVMNHTSYVVPRSFTNNVYTFYTYRNIARPVLENTSLLCSHGKLPENSIHSSNGFVSYLTEDEWVLVNRLFGPTAAIVVRTRAEQLLLQIENKVAAVKERIMQQARDRNLSSLYDTKPSTSQMPLPGETPQDLLKEVKTFITNCSNESDSITTSSDTCSNNYGSVKTELGSRPASLNSGGIDRGTIQNGGRSECTDSVMSDNSRDKNSVTATPDSASHMTSKPRNCGDNDNGYEQLKSAQVSLNHLVYTPSLCTDCVKEHSGIYYTNATIYIRPQEEGSMTKQNQVRPKPQPRTPSRTPKRSQRGDKVVKCDSEETIFEVKIKICGKLAVAPSEQMLTLENGNVLENESKLCDLGVMPGTVLLLFYSEIHQDESTIYTNTQEHGFKGTALSSI